MIAAELAAHESVLIALLSVAGGGTIVPLLYSIHQRRTPAAKVEAAVKDEARAAKAANEAVGAVRDVLAELRAERVEDRAEIARLKARCLELEAHTA